MTEHGHRDRPPISSQLNPLIAFLAVSLACKGREPECIDAAASARRVWAEEGFRLVDSRTMRRCANRLQGASPAQKASVRNEVDQLCMGERESLRALTDYVRWGFIIRSPEVAIGEALETIRAYPGRFPDAERQTRIAAAACGVIEAP